MHDPTTHPTALPERSTVHGSNRPATLRGVRCGTDRRRCTRHDPTIGWLRRDVGAVCGLSEGTPGRSHRTGILGLLEISVHAGPFRQTANTQDYGRDC